MAETIIPTIGARGIWTLLDPYTTVLAPGVVYACTGLRTIADVQAAGIDPYATYYNPTGTPIDRTKYDQDVAAGVMIVSLLSDDGNTVYVPTTYIKSFPAAGGVPYSVICLAVELPAIPEYVDLSAIKQIIADRVMDTIGVTCTVTEVKLSNTTLIDQQTSKGYEAARQANISNKTTDNAKLMAVSAQLQQAQQKIAALEQYIKTHMRS